VAQSPACDHCYAEGWAKRTGKDIWGARKPREIGTDSYWREPFKWNKEAAAAGERRRVFCSSLSDVFEGRKDLDPHRERLWKLMEATPSLDWLLLTKRPQNIRRMVPAEWLTKPRQNVWYGTTAETQKWLDIRAEFFVDLPAAVTFISAEPLMGPLWIRHWTKGYSQDVMHDRLDAPDGAVVGGMERVGDTWNRLSNVFSWLIVGGESGPGARRTDLSIFRDVRDQCRRAGIAFFMKQKGTVLAREMGCKDRAGADPDEFPEDLRIQEFPTPKIVAA
jgi:protein gp37